jgi:hypothetical protein
VKDTLPSIIDGKHVIKVETSACGDSPSYFKVRAGISVIREITDKGTSGRTNAIVSRNLFDGQVCLTRGNITVKKFNPVKPGVYRFSG